MAQGVNPGRTESTVSFMTRTLFGCTAALFALTLTLPGQSAPEWPTTPWGISSSASSFRDHADWFPKMSAAGVTTVRLFPEWRGFEPKSGTWKWDHGDALVKNAAANRIVI